MKKLGMFLIIGLCLFALFTAEPGFAQDPAAPAAAAPAEEAPAASNPGFFSVVASGGFMGIVLWIAIFGSMGALIWFIVDCSLTIKSDKIMPEDLIDHVTEAMEEGDILKALGACDDEPGPMADILTAGFSHVEEGFEVIQDSIQSAAELVQEQLMQRITYLSVVGNLAPMLGLLGTVQGMIAAFSNLATEAANTSLLAMNISQALYTTAAGLSVALPAVTMFYIFRNKCNTIILRMEAITIDLIKDLRNVEVVE